MSTFHFGFQNAFLINILKVYSLSDLSALKSLTVLLSEASGTLVEFIFCFACWQAVLQNILRANCLIIKLIEEHYIKSGRTCQYAIKLQSVFWIMFSTALRYRGYVNASVFFHRAWTFTFFSNSE